VAVLEQDGAPTHIGVTQRNVGTLDARDDENRIGMAVHPWQDVRTVPDQPNHPKVFVARGTHSNYLDTGNNGEHTIRPFSSEAFDIGRDSCGRIEELDGAISSVVEPPDSPSALVMIAKVLLGPAGWVWLGIESIAPFGTVDPDPSRKPLDMTPSEGQFGTAIRPRGLNLPEPVTSQQVWRTHQTVAPGGEIATTDGRRYGFIVDRKAQIWWPTRADRRGYDGRWGQNASHDPKYRRSGMRTPQFWLMFFIALARTK
jgi:hypothetical protein